MKNLLKNKKALASLLGVTMLVISVSSKAQNHGTPIDLLATQRTKQLLSCLASNYGVNCVTGIYGNAGTTNINNIISCSGQTPSILGMDLSGWNSVKYSSAYQSAIQQQINMLINHYNSGGIIQIEWHWPNPFQTNGTFSSAQIALTATQWDSITVPGTAQYNTMMADLAWHANYLKRLDSLDIPVLWRPLHEIDGGWFWWTNPTNKKGKTAELWRIVYNYLVNVRGFHNLIWVYSSGMASYTNTGGKILDTTAINWRKSYYPGSQYVDIAGIDLYGWDYSNNGTHSYGTGETATYTTMWNMMSQIAPGKMLALCECQALPNPIKTINNDPNFKKWLYAMPWYANDANNPCTWIDISYKHSFMINKSALCNSVVDVKEQKKSNNFIPTTSTLYQNYPNPFNPETIISYQLSAFSKVSLKVYDVLGRKVATLVDEEKSAGIYSETLHATFIPSGVYFYQLKVGGNIQTKKMILLK